MKHYYSNKQALVACVSGLLDISSQDSPLTMTITPVRSEGFYVSIATDASSEDTALQTAKFFSDTQPNI